MRLHKKTTKIEIPIRFQETSFTMRMVKCWSRYWRGSGISVFGDIPNSDRQGPEQQAVTACAALRGGVGQKDLKKPLLSQIFLWFNSSFGLQISIKSQSHPVKLPFTVQFEKFYMGNFHITNNEFFSLLTSPFKFNFISPIYCIIKVLWP